MPLEAETKSFLKKEEAETKRFRATYACRRADRSGHVAIDRVGLLQSRKPKVFLKKKRKPEVLPGNRAFFTGEARQRDTGADRSGVELVPRLGWIGYMRGRLRWLLSRMKPTSTSFVDWQVGIAA